MTLDDLKHVTMLYRMHIGRGPVSLDALEVALTAKYKICIATGQLVEAATIAKERAFLKTLSRSPTAPKVPS